MVGRITIVPHGVGANGSAQLEGHLTLTKASP